MIQWLYQLIYMEIASYAWVFPLIKWYNPRSDKWNLPLIITWSCQLSCEVQFPDGDNEVFHGFPVGSVPSQIQPAWAAWKAAWARNLADWEGWIYMAIWILFEALSSYMIWLAWGTACRTGYMQVPMSLSKIPQIWADPVTFCPSPNINPGIILYYYTFYLCALLLRYYWDYFNYCGVISDGSTSREYTSWN